MEIYVPDAKVIKEALTIIDEVYSAEEVEKVIMKLLRKYKEHVDYTGCGWYNIHKYVTTQHNKFEKSEELGL